MSYRAGFVCLLGLPNAGKSTLANHLVGERVSSVTSKPQTTRQRINGIVNGKNYQAIFVDPPGWINSDTGLNKFLRDEFISCAEDSDVAIAVLNIDAKSLIPLLDIVKKTKALKKPWFVVITKTDLVQKHRIDILKSQINDEQVHIIEYSSKKKPDIGKNEILEQIDKCLPLSPGPLFPMELYTTQNLRSLCSEIIREKCFEYLHQEVPYGLAVKINKFEEKDSGLVKIYADLVVNKANHRPMVIGRSAQMIKKIGSSARIEIEKLVDNKVFLDLHVKVKPQWTSNSKILEEFGYAPC